jgi:hypothetical protein
MRWPGSMRNDNKNVSFFFRKGCDSCGQVRVETWNHPRHRLLRGRIKDTSRENNNKAALNPNIEKMDTTDTG